MQRWHRADRRQNEALLLRASDLGPHDAPTVRPLGEPPALLRRARPVLLPVTSLMCANTDDLVMALTYDDGPDPVPTGAVLEALAEREQRATFFMLAAAATEYPWLVRDIVSAGHEIGLHGWDHALLANASPRRAVAAVRDSAHRLEDVAGTAVQLYRPTYGIQGWPQYLAARALGLDVVFWSAWAQDWLDDDVATLVARALDAAHPGGVLLLHDTTADAETSGLGWPSFDRGAVTAGIVDGLTNRGYALLTVGQLFNEYPAVRAITLRTPHAEARALLGTLTRPERDRANSISR